MPTLTRRVFRPGDDVWAPDKAEVFLPAKTVAPFSAGEAARLEVEAASLGPLPSGVALLLDDGALVAVEADRFAALLEDFERFRAGAQLENK